MEKLSKNADIISEIYNPAIFTTILTPNNRLREADFLYFPSCVRVVVFLRSIYSFGIPALINPSIKTSLMMMGATFS